MTDLRSHHKSSGMSSLKDKSECRHDSMLASHAFMLFGAPCGRRSNLAPSAMVQHARHWDGISAAMAVLLAVSFTKRPLHHLLSLFMLTSSHAERKVESGSCTSYSK